MRTKRKRTTINKPIVVELIGGPKCGDTHELPHALKDGEMMWVKHNGRYHWYDLVENRAYHAGTSDTLDG